MSFSSRTAAVTSSTLCRSPRPSGWTWCTNRWRRREFSYREGQLHSGDNRDPWPWWHITLTKSCIPLEHPIPKSMLVSHTCSADPLSHLCHQWSLCLAYFHHPHLTIPTHRFLYLMPTPAASPSPHLASIFPVRLVVTPISSSRSLHCCSHSFGLFLNEGKITGEDYFTEALAGSKMLCLVRKRTGFAFKLFL